MIRANNRATPRLIGAVFGMAVVVVAAGCSGPREMQSQVDPAVLSRQLAQACLQDAGRPAAATSFIGRGASASSSASGSAEEAAAAGAVRDGGAAACAATAAGGLAAPARDAASVMHGGAAARDTQEAPWMLATGSLPEAIAMTPRLPPPLVLRYAPESTRLRPADAGVLSRAVAELVASESVRLDVVVGRGGAGNAFDQAAVASARLRAIKDMLPPHVLGSVAFDPSLPDDTVSFHVVEVASAEPESR